MAKLVKRRLSLCAQKVQARRITVARPSCCAECSRFFRDPKRPGYGWCDEFAAAGHIKESVVCHPCVGRRREAKNGIK
jgi:hypothetical protein